MGNPLILYDIAPLLNPSFEDGTGGAVPTNWTDDEGNNEKNTNTTDDTIFAPGSTNGSSGSLQQTAGLGVPARCSQTVAWIPPVGVTVGVVMQFRTDQSVSIPTITLSSTTGNWSNVGTMSPSTSPGNDQWTTYFQEWTYNGTGGTDTSIELKITTTLGYAWWDHITMGRIVNFPDAAFTSFQARSQQRRIFLKGGSAYRSLELDDPSTVITAPMRPMAVNSTFEQAWSDFLGFSRYKKFSFWLDRESSYNEDHHYTECILNPESLDQSIPAGQYRYRNTFGFTAPLEWTQQEVA